MPLLAQLRKSVVLAIIGLASFGVCLEAHATVLDFNSQPTAFFVTPIVEQGYTFTSTADGFGTNNDPLWPSNGTIHLMSWTNQGSTSGFTLTANNNSVFSITSFAFGSGYVLPSIGDPVTSLTVSGTGGDTPFSQTFTSGVDYQDFGSGLTILSLLGGHTASVYTFTANGLLNRAQFDDITINATPPSAVPEPSTMLLFGCGMIGLAIIGRKKMRNKLEASSWA